MNDRIGLPHRIAPVPPDPQSEARRQRLAEQLRENLKKRKDQQRQRDDRARRGTHKGVTDIEA